MFGTFYSLVNHLIKLWRSTGTKSRYLLPRSLSLSLTMKDFDRLSDSLR